MTPRSRALDALFARARAAGVRVYGFSSARASCEVLPLKGVAGERLLAEWTHACCEGDREWTLLPAAEEAEEECAA
jgi:hypothetical protein